MTRPLSAEQKARNKAGALTARAEMSAALDAAVRRRDQALVCAVGVVEAVLLARDEATARRRASVALGAWDADGWCETYGDAATVAAALAGWLRLRGGAAA